MGSAAASDLKWSQGVVVMANGEVRQGELDFQFSEVVLFKAAGEVSVLNAIKLQSFRYYDQEKNINRKFISRVSGKQAIFYEVVVYGEVAVLRKPKFSLFHNRENSDRDGYDYFVSFQNNLSNLKQFRTKVYPTLVEYKGDIRLTISERHLNPNHQSDAIQIIQIYNKETSAETLVAGI